MYIDKFEAAKIIGCSIHYFIAARGPKPNKYPTPTNEAISSLERKRVPTKVGSYKDYFLKSDVEAVPPYTKQPKAKISYRDYVSEATKKWRELTGIKQGIPYESSPEQRQLHLDLLIEHRPVG